MKCGKSSLSGFIVRNGGAITKRSEGEAWTDFLRGEGATGNGLELENNWLRAKGGSGSTNHDLWSSYLNSKGFGAGDIGDRQRNFFDHGTQA